MSKPETRHVVMAKPGDVLIVANLQSTARFNTGEAIQDWEALGQALEKVGISVVLVAGDIDIALQGAPQQEELAPQATAVPIPPAIVCAHCTETNVHTCGRCEQKLCVKHFYDGGTHECKRR